AGNQIQKKGLDFINFVKAHSSIPIAAGFGISTTQHLEMLHDIADMAVIGSHVINLYNENGISGVDSFLTRIIHQIH
ncbi:tryptophan synthase subunit alpha, partial [bacterium]|nr:tryptophan synthase subunit alpha [bacterium]